MNIIRRKLLGWAVGLPVLSAMTAMPALARAQSFDEALDGVFRTGPVALGGGVVTPEGLVWSGVRGVRRAGSQDAVTLDERWHLGSNTKAMTSAVFARLVEQGRTRWGLTLAQAFPDLTVDPALRDVPIEALMRQTAGLINEPAIGEQWYKAAWKDPRPLPEQRTAIAAVALSQPPGGTPGEHHYANLNYVLVGAAIERITGGSWEDAMRTELYGPLGLQNAGFGPPPDPNAWGHESVLGLLSPISPTTDGADNPLAVGPAGTAHMSIADYGRWLQAVCGQGDWLSADSLARLNTPAEGETYSLGWMVGRAPPGSPVAGEPYLMHAGSNTRWHAFALVVPGRNLAAFAFTNDPAKGEEAVGALVLRLFSQAV